LLKKSLYLKIESLSKDSQSRFVIVDLKIEGKVLALAKNVYAQKKCYSYSYLNSFLDKSSWPPDDY